MRPFLALSLATALASVSGVAWMVAPRGGPGPAEVPLITADPSPVRVIPLSGETPKSAAAPPAKAAAPATVAAAPEAIAEAQARAPAPVEAPGVDVLAAVGQTLDGLRRAEEGAASRSGVLAPGQSEALRQLAARRKVRPVTRTSFPLEPGAAVPTQVYLHPVPAEIAALDPGGDAPGFAVVGGRFVVVGTQSRRILALSE
jgi:hypothetical protein